MARFLSFTETEFVGWELWQLVVEDEVDLRTDKISKKPADATRKLRVGVKWIIDH